jgi:hypothetical protein
MSRYKVLVDDNFHYMDEDERSEYGVFDSIEAAAAACRQIVDRSLQHLYKPGMTAAELYDQYTSFGDDPFIVPLGGGGAPARFSAWGYARDRCAAICAVTG